MLIIEERRLIQRQAVSRSTTDCPTLDIYAGDADKPVVLAMEMGCPRELYEHLIEVVEPQAMEMGLIADSRGRILVKGLMLEELQRLVREAIVVRDPNDYLKWSFNWPIGKTSYDVEI